MGGVQSNTENAEGPPSRSSIQAGSSGEAGPADKPQVRLVIGGDGHFAGGDEAMSVDAIVALLDHPPAKRRVQVHAAALDDGVYRRKQPREYVELRERVKLYERSLNTLIRGGAHYGWKWDEKQLARAIIELRSLALPPAGEERQVWFSWPSSDPANVVEIRLDSDDVDSVMTGWPDRCEQGVPDDAPIWLQQVFPEIAWERVIPAAILRAVLAQPETPAHVDVDDWVLSSRHPRELTRTAPPSLPSGSEPSPWDW